MDPHVTVLVLPSGAVDVAGLPLDSPRGGLDDTWDAVKRNAARLRMPVRVSVAQPDGLVEAHAVAPDGTAVIVDRHPLKRPTDPVDPQWMDGMPDRHELLALVRAADRAAQWRGARVAAERLAAQVRNELGDRHPHTVLAVELQGHFALRARDWVGAARLYTWAAGARYLLGAPASDTRTAMDNAVSCWTRSRRYDGAFTAGLDLAHVLVRAAPEPRGRLAAVLKGLDGAAR
ncbi:hypothetical protein [Streptomyces sp. RKAG337]|uniref:hypothetical protein n=1 Tax=Streptomyces sp. RKAG337 TaxID=2893404 RepID=UPI002033BA90|nr:hypothetical protein [Streptomyces sp. RKAG337]MCM2431001.1 hypothetical protein [Streptomyces sp. RKAG337]